MSPRTRTFATNSAFNIDLLSDPSASLMQTLGIGQSEWKGNKYWDRSSFVVDPQGVIRKVYEKVNPEGHEKTLLSDIKKLQTN